MPRFIVDETNFPGNQRSSTAVYNRATGDTNIGAGRGERSRRAQEEIDKETLRQRRARRAKSDKLREKDMPESAQELADRTADLGDVFRLFPNDANSFFDDYLNPLVDIGNMAAGLGSAPLAIQQGNYGDAAISVATPLLAGLGERLAEPIARAAGRYLTTETPIRSTYKINPFAYRPSYGDYFTEITPGSLRSMQDIGVLSESVDALGDPKFRRFLTETSGSGVRDDARPRLFTKELADPQSVGESNFIGATNPPSYPGSSSGNIKNPFVRLEGKSEYFPVSPIYGESVQLLQPNWLTGYKPVSATIDPTGAITTSGSYWPYFRDRVSLELEALKDQAANLKWSDVVQNVTEPYRWPFNPFVYTEDPTKVYRGLGEQGLNDLLSAGYFRPGDVGTYGKEVYFSPELFRAGNYAGINIPFDSPRVSSINYLREGTPYIAELPDNVARWTSLYNDAFDPNVRPYRSNPENWSLYTEDLIPAGKARILEPSRFRGLKPVSKRKLSKRAKKSKSGE